jgi:predicted PurR-regulated permease PerM
MSQQRDRHAKPPEGGHTEPQEDSRAGSHSDLTEPSISQQNAGVVWVRISSSQVIRTMVTALLTTAVVLGALFLIWQVRTFVGWFVIALFLAAVLNPAVNWLERRHRLIKRSLAIVVGVFVPLLVDQIKGLSRFIVTVAQAPEGPTEYLKGLAKQYQLGWVFERFSDQLGNIRDQLGKATSNFLLSTGDILVSAAGFIAALVTILTITFFLLLGSERYLHAFVQLFADQHRPLVRRLLTQSAGAVTGYVTGNLAISVICGVTTFVVLVILSMPYAGALALLVAVLDLIPLVGATLGGALLVIVGLFVEPWKAIVLLIYIVVYQQVEGSVLQPLVYSRAVQLSGLVIFVAVLIGGMLLGIPGALLAVPVAEIIRIVVTDLIAYRRTRRGASKPAV